MLLIRVKSAMQDEGVQIKASHCKSSGFTAVSKNASCHGFFGEGRTTGGRGMTGLSGPGELERRTQEGEE